MKIKFALALLFAVIMLPIQAASLLVQNQSPMTIQGIAYTSNGSVKTDSLDFFEAERLNAGFKIDRFVAIYMLPNGGYQKLGIQFSEPISDWAKITVGANGSCILRRNNIDTLIQLAPEEDV